MAFYSTSEYKTTFVEKFSYASLVDMTSNCDSILVFSVFISTGLHSILIFRLWSISITVLILFLSCSVILHETCHLWVNSRMTSDLLIFPCL